MPTYHPNDQNEQTLLSKDGDETFKPALCESLKEAVAEVRKWSETDQERARFRLKGRRVFTWAELKPHIDHL